MKYLILLLLGFTINCYTFRSGEYKGTKIDDFNLSSKTAVKFDVIFQTRIDGQIRANENKVIVDAWANSADEVLREVKNITPTKESLLADYVIESTVTESSDTLTSTVIPFISGLTLLVLPSYTRVENSVDTVIKDKKGKVLASFNKKENLSFVMQILLIFALPFGPLDNAKEQKSDLFRAVLKQINDEKIFAEKGKK